jgi:hypothetical protein
MFNSYRSYPGIASPDDELSVFSGDCSDADTLFSGTSALLKLLSELNHNVVNANVFDSCKDVCHKWSFDTGIDLQVRIAKQRGIKHNVACFLNLRRHRNAIVLIKLTYVSGEVYGVD